MDFPQVKGRLEYNYPLKKLNTWKIGGLGELVFWPENIDEFQKIADWGKKNGKPVSILGRGSNVLVPDQGIKGIIIVTSRLNKVYWEKETVTAEAGYSLVFLAREAAKRGLSGLEFACGIPGTLGAAVAINAGAYGKEIGMMVLQVKALTPEGDVVRLQAEDLCFGYRTSNLLEKNYAVLESRLKLTSEAEQDTIKNLMHEYLLKRRIEQPLEYPNAGSVFRNPPGDSAGRLIELAGWKGRRIGDAQVSEKHANFIVNRGKATAEEVLSLISAIREDVSLKFGVELKTEIRII